jgi:hypothetical protein
MAVHTTLLGLLGLAATAAATGVTDFSSMFQDTSDFSALSGLDTSAATTMVKMFSYSSTFNEPVDHLVTTNVGNMEAVFAFTAFNQPVGGWNTSNVQKMNTMFHQAFTFNQPIEHWDTSNVRDFTQTFRYSSFNQPIGDWDTSSATSMNQMFMYTPFNQPIGGWDTSGVTNMRSMFHSSSFAQELYGWDVGQVTNFRDMFSDSRMQREASAGGRGLGRACRLHHSWKAQTVGWDPVVAGLVADAAELDLPLCAPHLAGAPGAPPAPSPPPYPPMLPTGGYGIELICPPNTLHLGLEHGQMLARGAIEAGSCWDISAVANANGLFQYQAPPTAVEFELANGTDLTGMFRGGDINQRVTLTGLGSVSSTSEMFKMARLFNSPLSVEGLDSTGKWTDASSMFFGALVFNQPLAWDTSSVTNMDSMFDNTPDFNQPLAWDTSSVTNMNIMFYGAHVFNQPLAWDTSSVTSMKYMFHAAVAFNQPLAWNTSSVTNMADMFGRTAAFAQELDAWDVRQVTNFKFMFRTSRMRDEAVWGGPGFGRACRIHHSWKAQNAAWDPANAELVADATELDLSLCAPYLASSALQGDPHLGLGHGGKADFRGCDGCLFNFLSTRDVTVNARLSASTFRLRGSEVHGTFVTEVHVATLDRAKNKWFTASYWADGVGDGNWGWRAVNATCGGRTSYIALHATRACEGASVTVDLSTAVFALPEWEVKVQPRPVYDRIDGPMHRLDISLRPLLPEARLAEWPHGLIGQSFDGDARPRLGKQDDYSTKVVWTTAQAEGAIEGEAQDYRVASPFATEFRYSRFDPPVSGARGPAPAPTFAWAPVPGAAPAPVGAGPVGVATAFDDA